MNAHAIIMAWKEVRNINETPLRTLMQTFRALWYFVCSDERDRIFGLLSFINLHHGENSEFRPDYSSSTCEVYEKFARYHLQKSNDLDILHFCGKRPLQDSGITDINLPSWVPDWRPLALRKDLYEPLHQILTGSSMSEFSAATMKSTQINLDVPHTLRVHGMIFDTVVSISRSVTGPMYTPRDVTERFYSRGSQFLMFYETHVDQFKPYPTGEAPGEAIARTLVMDNRTYASKMLLGRETDPMSLYTVFSKWVLKCLLTGRVPFACPATGVLPTSDEHAAFHYHWALGTMTQGRSLFLTDKGYVGLGPNDLQEGDIISVLFGAQTPFVLRRQHDSFILVGDCYVHGIMYGESWDVEEFYETDEIDFLIL
jgi:hypothetical protein